MSRISIKGSDWRGTIIQKAQKNPAWWIREVLGGDLWSKQEDICQSIVDHERTAVPASFGVGKCLIYNEKVPLSDGRVVLADTLIGTQFGIIAFDEKTGKQVPSLAWATDNGVKPVYQVTAAGGSRVTRTGNHPLYAATLTKNKATTRLSDPGFRKIENLKIGDAVLLPKILKIEGQIPKSDDEVKLAGYLIGDGGTTGGVTFTQQEGPAKQEFVEVVERLGGICVPMKGDPLTFRVTGPKHVKKGGTSNNPILNLVREWKLLGKTAKVKSFPDWVWTLPNSQLALFLNRYFACDGWASSSIKINKQGKVRRSTEIAITSASKELIEDVELAMLRLGIRGFKACRTFSGKERGFKSEFLTACCWGCKTLESMERFSKVIGIYGKEVAVEQCLKVARGRKLIAPRRWTQMSLPSEEYIWVRIKDIEYIGPRKTVAISVPKYHTYLTTFVEHNTWLAARIALWFLYNFPGAKVISTAPTSRQVRDLLWSEIRTAHSQAKVKLGGDPLQLSLKLNDDQFAIGFSTEEGNMDMFTGYHSPNQLVIFDQAGGLPKMFWEAAEGLMTSENCRWLAISNTAISDCPLADICMPERKSKYGTWNIIHIGAEESPNVVAGRNIYPGLVAYDWVEKRRKAWGEDDPLYRIFVKGEFVPSVQMVVLPYQFLIHAYDKDGELDDDALEIGLDVARSGLDSTVWFVRCGSAALEMKRVTGNDTMQVAGETIEYIRYLERKYRKVVRTIKIDIIGLGAGVYDRLAEQDLPVLPINNSETKVVVDKERFSNVRAEMAWALRKRFEEGFIGLARLERKVPDLLENLKGDLQITKYKITSAGKILLQPKEEIKKELGRSPDYWDALVMAYEEPGGGPANVEFLKAEKEDEKVMSDEDWLSFMGTEVDIDDPSFHSVDF